MNDVDRLKQLLAADHPCISIVTTEEAQAREIARAGASENSDSLWTWSVACGIRPSQFEDSPSLPETEHPAAALFHFSRRLSGAAICIMLDLAGHLGDARTLRLLRETIDVFRTNRSHLILIDHDELPAIIAAHATPFEISLPTDDELERLVRSTLKQAHREGGVLDIKISRRELRTIIRNLSGLTPRDARQIILDVVADDRKAGQR